MSGRRDRLPASNSQLPISNSQVQSSIALDAARRASGVAMWSASVKAAARGRVVLTTVVAVAIGGSTSVLACPVCFGAEESSMIDGARLGVFVLLAITLAVQGAFVGFFVYLRKRAKRIAELDLDTEWSKLQDPSRAS